MTSIEYEYAYKKKNRLGTYWSRINAVLATDERNKPKFVVIGYLDITKQKKCEMEYQESLQKALFAAKTANNEKSRFLSNMSHDIRTPMNSIIGMTSIATLRMEEGPVDVECQRQVKDCLSNIDVASRHLLGLINDVLDMSRIESGCFQLHEEEFEIHDFVCSVNAIIQQQISEKSIEYIVEEAVMKDGVVKGDRTRLTQVVLNVLGNAVKYTPVKGRIVLRIREEELENGKRAMYQIDCEDTGCGIDEEFLPHIFDMFTQEQKRCSESYPGTGLGMSIAKSIIDLMQGTIHVKSEINKGTLFTIRVPLKICKSIPISRAKDSLLLEHKSILSNRNILVVEDLDMNAEVIRILIEMQGGTVTVVTNGKSAVETLCDSRENTYDAILMDIRMPIMDGYEATKRIRRFDRRDAQYIPIIAMSADAFEENIQESYNAGMNAHIAKPVRLELLEEVLEKYFNKEIQDDKTKEDT